LQDLTPASVKRMQAMIDQSSSLNDVPSLQRRPTTALPARDLKAGENASTAHRDRQIACAYLAGGRTMRELAEHFGVHVSTVSRAVGKHEQSV
jgi:hypothetical protein